MWVATVLAYLAQPIAALVWAGTAIASAIIFLAQARPGRPWAIAALALMPTQERDFASVEQVVRTLLLHDGADE